MHGLKVKQKFNWNVALTRTVRDTVVSKVHDGDAGNIVRRCAGME